MPEHDCLPADVSASDLVVHLGQMSGLPTRRRASGPPTRCATSGCRGAVPPDRRLLHRHEAAAKLAQALVHDPRLVLLDEPTNGLDPAGRDDMLALIRRIGTEFGIAVLVTSHLLGELERISDHVVVLDGGRLLRSSATTDFLHKTGNLLVEVEVGPTPTGCSAGPGRRGAARLTTDGRMIEVEARHDETTRDVVRDLAVDLGLGLVRMQERHHRIEDVFREEVPAVSSPSDPPPPRRPGRHPRHRLPALRRAPARRASGRLGAVRHRAAQLLRARQVRTVEDPADGPARADAAAGAHPGRRPGAGRRPARPRRAHRPLLDLPGHAAADLGLRRRAGAGADLARPPVPARSRSTSPARRGGRRTSWCAWRR